jgi:hypothetical protein
MIHRDADQPQKGTLGRDLLVTLRLKIPGTRFIEIAAGFGQAEIARCTHKQSCSKMRLWARYRLTNGGLPHAKFARNC